jgi:hypothetical protein
MFGRQELAGGDQGSGASGGTPATPEGTLSYASLDQKWAFEIAPEPISDDESTETIEADVVVIGAGVSGLVTANSAADQANRYLEQRGPDRPAGPQGPIGPVGTTTRRQPRTGHRDQGPAM